MPDFALYNSGEVSTPNPNTIVFALRQLKDLPASFIQTIKDFIEYVKKEKWEIKAVAFQEKGKDADSKILKKLDLPLSPFADFKTADLVLGMRFHSLILAIKSQKPFVAISYASKVSDYMKSIKMEEYTINLENLESKHLISLFKKLQKNKEQIKRKLGKINAKSEEKFHKFRDEFKKSI